ncbi:sodium:solute symporter family transporter [Gluconobacter kanchanaburiensis]|uniref:Sodium:solute symporter n=1 Tax=Gluconobacter kanchanaburiensis NBRC 103587 TaxID=1307948 RepID=A0A511B8C8_9PROT|nr:hypothetical protein [Gluconobacter kanchanaburiensis]MBF0862527.1 hypothetical protein [Gluconobacter kanchanaburiensis]GBR71734.1 symporter of Na+/proline [Gluconobacter kanchanaburiensis NBRC 103587]GEK96648.1 sodium:solute symporter [Gluconobacter kanchanaburiensis NBRC 103587]
MAASLLVILFYLCLLPVISITLARQPRKDLPPWAICLSLVATETSTLTIVSVPGVAYFRGYVFLGLAIGYLLGRTAVAVWFLPLHERGAPSVYRYIGQRFGSRLQKLLSGTFLLTRLVAEGVRLYAGMLPVSLLLASLGYPVPDFVLLALIVVLTSAYTLAGGLKAVVWSDSLQLCLYLGGSAACLAVIWTRGGLHTVPLAPVFSHGLPFFTDPFSVAGAIVGGGILALASHGTDQLMLQRCLAAKSLAGARVAMIGSVFVVAALFALLSITGIALRQVMPGWRMSPDALFPQFILTLPPLLSGLLVAGILAATMGSLSSAMNAMAAATRADFLPHGPLSLRSLTAIWATLLVATAALFSHPSGSAVVFGLSIASYSYGATLGVFLLAMIEHQRDEQAAITGFLTAVAVLGGVSFIKIGGHGIAFPWLVPIGVIATFVGATAFSGLRRIGLQK